MKVLILIILSFSLTNISFAQELKCHHVNSLVKTLNESHILPQEINQEFSEKVIDLYIEKLDPYQDIFLKKDVNKIKKLSTNLHNNLGINACKLTKLSKEIYLNRLLQLDSIFVEIGKNPFNTKSTGTVNYSTISDFSQDLKTLEKEWKDWLHFRTNEYIYNYYYSQDAMIGSPSDYEITTREHIIKKYRCKMDQRKNIDFVNTLFKSITLSFDPHSSFMTKASKQKFQNALSRNTKTFGLSLSFNENEAIEISYLQPNGPAWKSNLLSENDIIKSIKANGKEYINSCVNPYSLIDDIEAQNIDKISITFIHQQITNTISLTKEELIADNNSLKGFVINGEKKVGYLSIPSFYTQWDGQSGNGVASDVAKEVLKLKRENIEGLILDLRNNGGGSVQEALDFIGIFINEGTLALAKLPNDQTLLLKDPNRGVIFEKPLIVMVNKGSASASEILSSSLQEYNRALIVGSQTYGKATGQNIKDVRNKYGEIIGHVKVTDLKLYKTDGTTNQELGVQPDIELKGIWDEYYDQESEQQYVLSADSIQKKIDINSFPALPINLLLAKSQDRINSSENFKMTYHYIDSLDRNKDKDLILSLNYVDYQKQEEQINKDWQSVLKSVSAKTSAFSVTNNKFDNILIQMNETVDAINKQIIENLESDIYIEETYFILADLINTTK